MLLGLESVFRTKRLEGSSSVWVLRSSEDEEQEEVKEFHYGEETVWNKSNRGLHKTKHESNPVEV